MNGNTPERKLAERSVFDSAVRTAKSLLTDGGLRWLVTSTGTIRPRVDEQALERLVTDQLERRGIIRALQRDVAWCLEALAHSYSVGYLINRLEPEIERPADVRADLETRLSAVEEQLFSFALRERVLLRRTCKSLSLDNLTWQTGIKRHDLGEGPLPHLVYGTVELMFAPAAPNFPPPLRHLFGGDFTKVSFDCHLEDVEGLIADLESLRDNLRALGNHER